jgi:regulator of sigma E protease
MRIERFSIGFGPGILKRVSKKTGTTFQLAPIPFGGFVEIRGMNIAEEVDPDDHHAYPNRPAWQRFITIFAGPATNYLSAIVLALLLYNCHGMESPWQWYGVDKVNAGYDAHGKLESGDRILAVDGVPVVASGQYRMPSGEIVKSGGLTDRVNATRPPGKGGPVNLRIRRDGRELDVSIQPKLVYRDLWNDCSQAEPERERRDEPGAKEEAVRECASRRVTPMYLLGIVPIRQTDTLDVGVVIATREAFLYPIDMTKRIGIGIYEIFTGKEDADPGGPKRIYDEFTKAWKLGAVTGINLLMLLSVYLGLFNLLPLPALDGGRLVFLSYELVTRRRANPKIEAMVHMAGIMILGVVMILVTLRDCHVI